MYKPIKDYAIIGNLRSAALVSKDGSIDWLPAPFIDSSSVFAKILDRRKGGSWDIFPAEKFKVSQKYIFHTNILVTSFKTSKGEAELIDFIPIEEEKDRKILPREKEALLEVNRKIVCKSGTCKFRVVFNPKLNYAIGETKLSRAKNGITVANNLEEGILVSQAEYKIGKDGAMANIDLKEGEHHCLTFRYNSIRNIKDEDSHYENEFKRTKDFWDRWVHKCETGKCIVAGPWHDDIIRSSLILKILFFEPPGTIAAAATTSLPEEIGGVRNWDYRFTWIRDSAFTLQALFKLGYIDEAEKYVKWIINDCCSLVGNKPENMQIMYGLRGEQDLTEKFLPHLEGYNESKPVRIGNGAYLQKQWDIYGSILDTAWQMHKLEKYKAINKNIWKILRSLANYVVGIWKEADEGLWEVRGGKRHFVYSKVMCWVALDRALKIAGAYNFDGEVDVWRKEKDLIRREVMGKGWSGKKKSFIQSYNSDVMDASLLRLPVMGFIDGKHPKMLSTIRCIEKELLQNKIFVLRYNCGDGLPGKEGAFLLASFWLVDAYVYSGQKSKAKKLFEKLAELQNHVGLFSEEINPKTKEFLGNYPQAYTHIGFINSAINLSLFK